MKLEVSRYHSVKSVPLGHTTNKSVKLNARAIAIKDLILILIKLNVLNVTKECTKMKIINRSVKSAGSENSTIMSQDKF